MKALKTGFRNSRFWPLKKNKKKKMVEVKCTKFASEKAKIFQGRAGG